MQWVFLIGERGFSLHSFSGMRFSGSTRIYRDSERIEIQYPDREYILLEPYSAAELAMDYSPAEFSEFRKQLPFAEPEWMILKYRSLARLKQFLAEEGFPKDVFIDCGGVNLGLEEVFDAERLLETELPRK